MLSRIIVATVALALPGGLIWAFGIPTIERHVDGAPNYLVRPGRRSRY